MRNFFRSFYIDLRFFLIVGAIVVLFVLGYFFPILIGIGKVALLGLLVLLVFDILILYRTGEGIRALRDMAERLSNGDENEIRLYVRNLYPLPITARVVDETPFQFQERNASHEVTLPSRGEKILRYVLRPTRRGEYIFGAVNVYAMTPIRFVQRRYRFASEQMVAVYPSYIQLRKYELMAHSNRLAEIGIKKVRRIGQTMEFDQIRNYVVGDDYRNVNWKATARKADLMVNQFQDERSQRIYSVIDKGRVMKMPFAQMTLLDYAINASLVLSNIAIYKHDRAGLITFSNRVETTLAAERTRLQMHKIVETLYNQETDFPESDFEALYVTLQRKLSHRSIIFLYTNFETLSALHRQLPSLRKIAGRHLLVVIFFENTELRTLLKSRPATTEEVAIKTVAEKFAYEKRLIVKELERHGILSIYTSPESLTANSINKYLEIKARRLT